MKRLQLCLATLALAASACAQQNTNPEKYAKYITAEEARKHLSILASDAFEGRETGKPGADKAANYTADVFINRAGIQTGATTDAI